MQTFACPFDKVGEHHRLAVLNLVLIGSRAVVEKGTPGEAAGAKETEKTESAIGVQCQDGLPSPAVRVRDVLAAGVCWKADYIIELLSVQSC